jgi:phosphatidylethanolamine/phosphatidyl-N-methylethanolamine N-methyltransferase
MAGIDTRFFYNRIAPIYDLVFGPILENGRKRACENLNGHRNILEVGVGTGLTLLHYPHHCRICCVDISPKMICRARQRCNNGHVDFSVMDAAFLGFRDGSFDAVFAPYVVTVVPDPDLLCRELVRVVRPGGQIVVLSHSQNSSWADSFIKLVSPLTRHIGFRTDLNVEKTLREAGVLIERTERVNFLKLHHLYIGRRPLS